MPTLARVFIKTGLVYLVLGLVAGFVAELRLVYLHLFMVGWVTHLIFGVSWWMFPPLGKGRPRGSEAPLWFVYAALNCGLLLRAVAEPIHGLHGGDLWGSLLAASAILQVAAGFTYAVCLWPRVRGRQESKTG